MNNNNNKEEDEDKDDDVHQWLQLQTTAKRIQRATRATTTKHRIKNMLESIINSLLQINFFHRRASPGLPFLLALEKTILNLKKRMRMVSKPTYWRYQGEIEKQKPMETYNTFTASTTFCSLSQSRTWLSWRKRRKANLILKLVTTRRPQMVRVF